MNRNFFFALACALAVASSARASSHREAPFITSLPKADNTDVYAFNSYEAGRQGFVTLIADYQPLQDPGGSPNFYMLDPSVLYEIHIDNNGKGTADLTFSFQFANEIQDVQLPVNGKNVSIPLINAGPVTASDTSKLNVKEMYTVSVYKGPSRANQQAITNRNGGSANFEKPVDNIGNKSIPDYEAYARAHIYDVNVPGCDTPARLFVGQRKEPFAVNVGELFDLVNLKDPLGSMDQGKNGLANNNITSFEIEIASKCIAASNQVIGVWATASMQRSRVGKQPFLPASNANGAPNDWVQVSRLGMPLVNEIVVGYTDKNRFNASEPKDDAQFLDYVLHPSFPTLVAQLFAAQGVKAPSVDRTDLVTVFLKGIPNVNANGSTAEMLRLNVITRPTPMAQQSNLGVLGKDSAGFPNGRRPGDDVVDIELRVAMGALLPQDQAPSGQLPFTDGAYVDASKFDAAFPYLKTPLTASPLPIH